MGTRPAKPFGEPICNKIELIKKTLEDAGYHVRYYTGTSGKRLLIVNEACTVADNVECDPGQAFNVTAAIDDLDFEEELKIGHRRECPGQRRLQQRLPLHPHGLRR